VGIPISAIGFILSAIGLGFACFKKFKSAELPILGCVLCIGAISLSIISTHLAAAAIARQADAEKEQAERDEKAREDALNQGRIQEAEQRKKEVENLGLQLISLNNDFANQQEIVSQAQTNYDFIKSNHDVFISTEPYETNVVYIKYKKDFNFRTALIAAKEEAVENLENQVEINSRPAQPTMEILGGKWTQVGGDDTSRKALYEACKKYLATAIQDRQKNYDQIGIDKSQLEQIVQSVTRFQENKLNESMNTLEEAKANLERTKSRIENVKSEINGLN
jgi:hypothetical protein